MYRAQLKNSLLMLFPWLNNLKKEMELFSPLTITLEFCWPKKGLQVDLHHGLVIPNLPVANSCIVMPNELKYSIVGLHLR